MKRRYWTAAQIRKLRRLYPNTAAPELARRLRRTRSAIDNIASKLGLRKSPEFLAANCLQKGNVPWNVGKRGYMGANVASFRNGNLPWTWRPVGSERLTKDGLLQRKVADTRSKSLDWKLVHVLVWEAANGPVPAGHIVIFRDRDRRNFDPANLECVTRAENMRRNTYHRYPKAVASLIQLRGALNRQINRREGRSA
jgi:hypothetical protein